MHLQIKYDLILSLTVRRNAGTEVIESMIQTKLLVLLLIGMMLSVPTRAKSQISKSDQDLQEYLKSLKRETLSERSSAVIALHRLGKKAILALVEHISDAEIAPSSTLMLHTPFISAVYTGAPRDEFAGVLNAYVVELILAKDNLATTERDPHLLLSVGDYVYGQGALVKGESSTTDMSDVSGMSQVNATDLPHIKRTYSEWWRRNKNKTLAEMRRDWKANRCPLTGSPYHWE